MTRVFVIVLCLGAAACGGSPTRPSATAAGTTVSTPTQPPTDPTSPGPVPTPTPAPTPPAAPQPDPMPVSIPYYAQVVSQFSCSFPASEFTVEWFPGRLVFGQTTFTSIVGPASGDEPGDAIATIKDDHHQTIVRLELISTDGRTWQWGYDGDSCHAVGSLKRR